MTIITRTGDTGYHGIGVLVLDIKVNKGLNESFIISVRYKNERKENVNCVTSYMYVGHRSFTTTSRSFSLIEVKEFEGPYRRELYGNY